MTYPSHPAAALFPLIEGAEFSALVADIKANGLVEPIKLYDGQVLDGRNRLRACEHAGVEPMFEDLTGKVEPLVYVVSANLHRRHLTSGQKAFIASELATLRHGSNQYRTETEESSTEPSSPDVEMMTKIQAAKAAGSSPAAISKARVIEKEAPELVAAVKAGKESLDGAYNKAVEAREAKTRPLPKTTDEHVKMRKGRTEPAEPPKQIPFEKVLEDRYVAQKWYGGKKPGQADYDELFAGLKPRQREQLLDIMGDMYGHIQETAFADVQKRGLELLERQRELEQLRDKLNVRDADVSKHMKKDDYKSVLGCLHSDRAVSVCPKCGERNVDEDLRKRLDKAFNIFNRLQIWVERANDLRTLRARGWAPPPQPRRK